MAMAAGSSPTLMALSAVLVAVSIGVTVRTSLPPSGIDQRNSAQRLSRGAFGKVGKVAEDGSSQR
jgi:hypothetical protein